MELELNIYKKKLLANIENNFLKECQNDIDEILKKKII